MKMGTDWFFLVKSAYRQFIDEGYRLLGADLIWKAKCPLKCKAFLCLVIKRAILTWLGLQRRGWLGPDIYILCHKNEETTEHVLLNYESAFDVWRCTMFVHGLSIDLYDPFSLWTRQGKNTRKSRFRTIILASICWNLRGERNNKIFTDTTAPLILLYSYYSWYIPSDKSTFRRRAPTAIRRWYWWQSDDGIDGNGDREQEEEPGRMSTDLGGGARHTWRQCPTYMSCLM